MTMTLGIGISKIFGIGIEICSGSRDPAVGTPYKKYCVSVRLPRRLEYGSLLLRSLNIYSLQHMHV
jgi:hypothetical protein